MPTEIDELRHQSEEHPLVPVTGFHSIEEYGLYLSHRFAYEEAAAFATGKIVLDVGCNNGYGTVIVAAKSKRTVGVDVSPSAVRCAQACNARPNVQYQTIDGLALPFEDDAFELVVSFEVIEHITDVARYLAEIRRVLKPGGTALLTTPNARMRLDPGMKPWNEFHVREYLAPELRALLGGWFDRVELRGLLAQADLYEVEVKRVQRAKAQTLRKRAVQQRASYKASRLIVESIKAILPGAAADALRRVVRKGQPAPAAATLDADTMRCYSTADFFYRTDGLDDALDFMAVCS